MKRLIALMLLLALCLSLVACGGKAEAPAATEKPAEEKKALPVATQAAEEVPAETLYRDAMIPFEELVPAERIVILQNTLNFGREGFYTEETKPVTEEVNLDGQTVAAYKLTYALDFLTFGYENGAQVVNAAGEVLEFTKEDLEGSYVYIEGFQSYTLPVLFNPATGVKVVDFDHFITDNEMVISIITEQSRRCMDMFEMIGWDTTTATYHVMATDKFFVPATPVDYDDGEIRGALSGSVNGTFPEMVPAQGKINDVVYIEKVVN
jgi:hypothetical protein